MLLLPQYSQITCLPCQYTKLSNSLRVCFWSTTGVTTTGGKTTGVREIRIHCM